VGITCKELNIFEFDWVGFLFSIGEKDEWGKIYY
jgi:hypothetical protein